MNPPSANFTLLDVLKEQSRDLYDAESSYLNFISDLVGKAETTEFQELIGEIALDTRRNIADLEAVCLRLDVPPNGIRCEAMAGLLREAKEATQEYDTGTVRDAALIASAQRIAHYEIAGFGTARDFAASLRLGPVENLFSEMLDRACDNDKALSKIAKGSWLSDGINDLAVKGD